jgi:eukaryotic-like serine/threonine-protein kinase
MEQIWNRIKEFFIKIFSHPLVKSPFIAFAIIAIAIFLFFAFLHVFSRHGRSFPVPDFSGLTYEKAQLLAKKKKLRLEVIDSVYIIVREPGTVIEQNPSVGTYVKANRRVLLTTNAINPMLVEMPNLVGLSLRQAISTLNLQGFKIGVLAFTPDIAVNNVLEQHYRGKEIDPNAQIPKGSTIDLLLGNGLSNEKTILPRVIGLTLAEARNLLLEASLNLGKYTFDATIIDNLDSLQARVYSQYPNPIGQAAINFGARIDLWLTQNESRIPPDPSLMEDKKPKVRVTAPVEEILE